MKNRILKLLISAIIIPAGLLMQACSSTDIGGKQDKVKPEVGMLVICDADLPNCNDITGNNEIIGDAVVRWETDEVNHSTVRVYLHKSADDNNPVEITDVEGASIVDNGEFIFDTNTVDDCRDCYLSIVVRDVVGNESDPADPAEIGRAHV